MIAPSLPLLLVVSSSRLERPIVMLRARVVVVVVLVWVVSPFVLGGARGVLKSSS